MNSKIEWITNNINLADKNLERKNKELKNIQEMREDLKYRLKHFEDKHTSILTEIDKINEKRKNLLDLLDETTKEVIYNAEEEDFYGALYRSTILNDNSSHKDEYKTKFICNDEIIVTDGVRIYIEKIKNKDYQYGIHYASHNDIVNNIKNKGNKISIKYMDENKLSTFIGIMDLKEGFLNLDTLREWKNVSYNFIIKNIVYEENNTLRTKSVFNINNEYIAFNKKFINEIKLLFKDEMFTIKYIGCDKPIILYNEQKLLLICPMSLTDDEKFEIDEKVRTMNIKNKIDYDVTRIMYE